MDDSRFRPELAIFQMLIVNQINFIISNSIHKNTSRDLRRLAEVLKRGWRNRIDNAAQPMSTFLLLNLNFNIIALAMWCDRVYYENWCDSTIDDDLT